MIFADIEATLARLGIVDGSPSSMNAPLRRRRVDATSSSELTARRGDVREADDALWFRDQPTLARRTATTSPPTPFSIKQSGEPTYRTPDIAYHVDKFERGFDTL